MTACRALQLESSSWYQSLLSRFKDEKKSWIFLDSPFASCSKLKIGLKRGLLHPFGPVLRLITSKREMRKISAEQEQLTAAFPGVSWAWDPSAGWIGNTSDMYLIQIDPTVSPVWWSMRHALSVVGQSASGEVADSLGEALLVVRAFYEELRR